MRGRPLRALLLALVLALPAAAADLRRLESVGVVPVDDAGRRESHRQRAVGAAVARAVEQVAQRALAGAPPEPPEDPGRARPDAIAPSPAPALGSDPFEYATRFRILEDRGIRPALLSGGDAASEYVVLVEVFVDATRIGERLTAAGWREEPAGLQGTRVRLVLEGLRSFQAYDALRRVLSDELRVRSAIPVELVRGRAVLEVDSDYDSDGLLAALQGSAEPGLRVIPVSREVGGLTVLVDWTAPRVPAGGAGAREGPTRRR